MPKTFIHYTRDETANLVRLDAQKRTGEVLLASEMTRREDGGWALEISTPEEPNTD